MKTDINWYLNQIIDELNPNFKALSDEVTVDLNETYGTYERIFTRPDGSKFKMKWRVYHGTPETVRTEFEPAIAI